VTDTGPALRVMIVDDHPLVRSAVARALSSNNMLVVAEASSAEEALALAPTVAPDVLLLDIALPGMSGVQLVRDLAKELKMRIEMRQIGVRDEAKLIGGLGVCGRPLCCATFMRTFEPVTIQKARKQQIVINPTKISGLCGRLMCCLAFEEDSRGRMYADEEERLIED